MENIPDKKDQIMGKMKETAGKVIGDEGMEFGGKLQTMKADLSNTMDHLKQEVVIEANNLIDKGRGKMKDQNDKTNNNTKQ